MPLYEFQCQQCERQFELLVRSSQWRGSACPHCGSQKLEKQLSTFAPASSSASGPACETGACPMAPVAPAGCGGCCGGGPHRH